MINQLKDETGCVIRAHNTVYQNRIQQNFRRVMGKGNQMDKTIDKRKKCSGQEKLNKSIQKRDVTDINDLSQLGKLRRDGDVCFTTRNGRTFSIVNLKMR